jgi:hypothetical protein
VNVGEDEAAIAVADQPGTTGSLTVARWLGADRGVVGTFEFDMMDKYSRPDQPFFVSGTEVATAVSGAAFDPARHAIDQ